MAAQLVGAEATAASVDAAAFLLPHHQSSYSYSLKVRDKAPRKPHDDKPPIRCMVKRVKQLLARGSSPALYLVSKAKELRRHCFRDEAWGASEVGYGLMGMEAYFSIPVVVPVTSSVV